MTDYNTQQVSRTDAQPWQDEETARYYYVQRGFSSYEVADQLGCAGGTALKWLKRHGIDTSRSYSELQNEDYLREKYLNEGMSSVELAEEIGCSKSGVLHALQKFGVERRPGPYREGPWRDEDTLREEYVEKGRHVGELADEWDTGGMTIYKWLNRHGIDHRHGPRSGEEHPNYGITGEDHWRWKGGFDRHYGANWETQRKRARERDNHKCQSCGRKREGGERRLDVHHIRRLDWYKERYDAPEWYERGNQLDNLVTLCRKCHEKWEGVPVRPKLIASDD